MHIVFINFLSYYYMSCISMLDSNETSFLFLSRGDHIISAFWSQPNLPSKGDTEIYIIYEISVIQILPSRITFDRDLSLSFSLSFSLLLIGGFHYEGNLEPPFPFPLEALEPSEEPETPEEPLPLEPPLPEPGELPEEPESEEPELPEEPLDPPLPCWCSQLLRSEKEITIRVRCETKIC